MENKQLDLYENWEMPNIHELSNLQLAEMAAEFQYKAFMEDNPKFHEATMTALQELIDRLTPNP